MSGKQNFIFFFGVALIAVTFFFGGQWHTFWASTFGGPANSKSVKKPTIKRKTIPPGSAPHG